MILAELGFSNSQAALLRLLRLGMLSHQAVHAAQVAQDTCNFRVPRSEDLLGQSKQFLIFPGGCAVVALFPKRLRLAINRIKLSPGVAAVWFVSLSRLDIPLRLPAYGHKQDYGETQQ